MPIILQLASMLAKGLLGVREIRTENHHHPLEQLRSIPAANLLTLAIPPSSINLLPILLLVPQDAAHKTVQKFFYLGPRPLGAQPLGIHEEIKSKLLPSLQLHGTSDAVLQMCDADAALQTFTLLALKSRFDDALQSVCAALAEEFIRGVALG